MTKTRHWWSFGPGNGGSRAESRHRSSFPGGVGERGCGQNAPPEFRPAGMPDGCWPRRHPTAGTGPLHHTEQLTTKDTTYEDPAGLSAAGSPLPDRGHRNDQVPLSRSRRRLLLALAGLPSVAILGLAGCTDTSASRPAAAASVAPAPFALQQQFVQVVEQVGPSVVLVKSNHGLGSGVVLDARATSSPTTTWSPTARTSRSSWLTASNMPPGWSAPSHPMT